MPTSNIGLRQFPYALPVNITPSASLRDPDALLAQVSEQERRYYQDSFRPLNRELIDDVGSTALVDTARETAGRQYDAAQARNRRQLSRFGYSGNALDRKVQERVVEHGSGLNFDNLVNTSRLQQYDRNVGLRNELINISRGIAKDVMGNLGDAAAMQSGREAMNEQINAQNKAQKYNTLGTLASTAMMLAMI